MFLRIEVLQALCDHRLASTLRDGRRGCIMTSSCRNKLNFMDIRGKEGTIVSMCPRRHLCIDDDDGDAEQRLTVVTEIAEQQNGLVNVS